jgi:hypothetical protein
MRVDGHLNEKISHFPSAAARLCMDADHNSPEKRSQCYYYSKVKVGGDANANARCMRCGQSVGIGVAATVRAMVESFP